MTEDQQKIREQFGIDHMLQDQPLTTQGILDVAKLFDKDAFEKILRLLQHVKVEEIDANTIRVSVLLRK